MIGSRASRAVREYRNSLVHEREEDVPPISIEDSPGAFVPILRLPATDLVIDIPRDSRFVP